MRKKFSFIYPVTQKQPDFYQTRNSPVYKHITDLIIKGTAYMNADTGKPANNRLYEFCIDQILYSKTNTPFKNEVEIHSHIEAACINHMHFLFNNEMPDTKEAAILPINYFSGRVISMPLKKKVN